jgi:hypothetical protein
VNGITFLVLHRVEGKREVGEWDDYSKKRFEMLIIS